MDLSWSTLEFNALKHPEPSKLAILRGPMHPCKKQVHSPFHYKVPTWSSGQDFFLSSASPTGKGEEELGIIFEGVVKEDGNITPLIDTPDAIL